MATKKILATIELAGQKFEEGDETSLHEVALAEEVDLTPLVGTALQGDWKDTKKASDARIAREDARAERQGIQIHRGVSAK